MSEIGLLHNLNGQQWAGEDMMALSGMNHNFKIRCFSKAVMSYTQQAVLMFSGKFLRSRAVWLGLRDETPNKYPQQQHQRASVSTFKMNIFLHRKWQVKIIMSWFFKEGGCAVEAKRIQKVKVFYWILNFYFLWIQDMLTICALGSTWNSSHPYIIRFNTGYSMTGRQSGINLFIFKMLLKSFRSCKVLNWKENLGSNNKEALERQTITSESSIWILLCKSIYAISQKPFQWNKVFLIY